MFLGMVLFAQISSSCARGDSVRTLASVAETESGFNTLAIHDNTAGVTFQPKDDAAARSLAHDLIVNRGHSVDLGLMQINSANLRRVGLSIDDAFDACHSLAAGVRILKDDYRQALRTALSRYNTGDRERGFSNGYVRRVELAGEALPMLGSLPSPDKAQSITTSLALPVVVLDMLHFNQIAAEPHDEPSNLLSGIAPAIRHSGLIAVTDAVQRPAG